MSDVLRMENVGIDYANRRTRMRIVDDVSLSIGPGEALGLVGESGCGKSTLALAALSYLPRGMRVSSGRVLFDGRDLATLDDAALRSLRGNRVAMVYQDPMSSLNPVVTIGRQLVEVPMLHGERSAAAARDRAIAMLAEVRLPDPERMMSRYPHELSGGQQQRVVIAMALMAEPALLILDEPTTGLDVTIEAAILDLVRELRRKFGTAILFISHNLGTVARICDRIGVLYAGRLVETGDIRAVFGAPAHPYTRGLLAALPRLEAGRGGARLTPVAGTLTAADRARVGCAFSPRCSHALPAACDAGPVPMLPADAEPGHVARCARLEAVRDSRPATPAAEATRGRDEDSPVLLDVRDLSMVYAIGGGLSGGPRAELRALSDVSLAADAGRTLAVVGESGSGKSTLAKLLSGLVTASEGQALFAGADLAALPVDERPADLKRRLQMVFQNPDSTLNPSHSIEHAVVRPLRLLRGLGRAQAKEAAARLLERVRLPADMLRRMPHQLSGGQRQRVALARAFAGDPQLVIADEPTSALDVSVQAAIVNLLAELQDASGIALLLISHDLALVRHMADRVAVLYLGRIVEYGPADLVFAPPWHPYTKALLAAAPRPDPDAPEPEVILGGVMPSPLDPPKGCVFASRCPRRIGPVCDTTPPPVRHPAPGLTVACHLEIADLPS
ncbi:ABC transporter ATP-binding protein [Alsobacter sp. SYSU M60028]|uniref:ABC transporter ATP-binding protein n=1 Tax=Alsobacter ponti TaxID=2962936 RepID=A0ABT1L914_9HYPH|nr:ABC transporter ATP-binding protein [Alsobacter ponti]MCP8937990.1 ABC transporter ATP-binding protein [Alsobacter ponti]